MANNVAMSRFPVARLAATAAIVPQSIMPSMPMLKTPVRSVKRPPAPANMSGADSRMLAASQSRTMLGRSMGRLLSQRLRLLPPCDPNPLGEANGDHEEHRQGLDHLGNGGRDADRHLHLACSGAQQAEEQRGQDNRQRIAVGHQGDRNTVIAETA